MNAKRRLTANDLLNFQMVDDPQVSPDGTQVAWVRTWLDADQNRYRSQIQLTRLDDGSARQLTTGLGMDTYPRWSPDGRFLLYLASPATPSPSKSPISVLDRGSQLHVIEPTSDKSWQLTNLRGGTAGPSWSPDGTRIAFLTYVDPAIGLESIAPATTDDSDGKGDDDLYTRFNRDVLVTHRLRWKFDSIGYLGDYRRQIALVKFNPTAPPMPPLLLTRGEFDLSAPAWSPDGQTLATSGNLDPDGEMVRSLHIYLVDVAQAEERGQTVPPKKLFGLEEMRSQDLAWSPDGLTLAVCGHDDPVIGHYGNQYLWLIDVASGKGRCVTAWLDRALGDYSRNSDMRRYGGEDGPRWLPNGEKLLALVNEHGSVDLIEIDPAQEQATPLTQGKHSVVAFTLDSSCQTAVLLIGDDLNPGDLYLLDRNEDTSASGLPTLRRLTAVNEALRSEIAWEEPLRFMAKNGDIEIDTWVMPPVGYREEEAKGKRYPVILYTGGGPGGMRASVFCHEFHLYTAQGYAVVHCNTRGNHGYGQDFSVATRGKWGDLDYEDNMAAIHQACEMFDFIDSERIAVAGGSYGGYTATWIASRHPELKAAVVDRCLYNRYSFNGTGDIGFLLDRVEFDKQPPWADPTPYLERSPLTYIGGIKSPTLVVHSELDHRCPVEQGEQLYTALKRLGVPTKFVRFPNESHELSRSGRPWSRIFRLNAYLDWFAQWL